MKKKSQTDQALRECLAGIEAILAKRSYLSRQESDRAYALEHRVRGRLEAEDAAKLTLEASEFVSTYLPQIEKSRARIQEREVEAAKAGEEQLAARKAREAEMAAKLGEQEQRRLAQVEALRQLG